MNIYKLIPFYIIKTCIHITFLSCFQRNFSHKKAGLYYIKGQILYDMKNENPILSAHQLEVILSLEKSTEKGRSEGRRCLPHMPLCNRKRFFEHR